MSNMLCLLWKNRRKYEKIYTKVATKVVTLRILTKVPPSIHLDLPQIIKK